MVRLLPLLFSALVASGCGRSDEEALHAKSFSPEAGRAALVNYFRDEPKAFELAFDPGEYSEKRLVNKKDGQYELGSFRIDVPNHRYHLMLNCQGKGCDIEYKGAFEFQEGRWIAKQPSIKWAHQGR